MFLYHSFCVIFIIIVSWFLYSPLYEISKFQRNSCSFPYLISNQTLSQKTHKFLYLTNIDGVRTICMTPLSEHDSGKAANHFAECVRYLVLATVLGLVLGTVSSTGFRRTKMNKT